MNTNIIIGEFCGWVYVALATDSSAVRIVGYPPVEWTKNHDPVIGLGGALYEFPDFENDYNAIHYAISKLTVDQQCDMVVILKRDVLMFKKTTIGATCKELCEAFIKLITLAR